MSNLDFSGFKKRRRGDRVYKFKAFCDQGYPVEFKGSFHQNVRTLLEFGQVESGLCYPMSSWSFQLEVHRHPTINVFLFVVEEPVELCPNICCTHCQYTGWGNHLICNKKYHFLLPSKDTVSACLSFEGNSNSGNTATGSLLACKYNNFIELQDHSMHGVFHSNGFGHLLCINGAERTSSDLDGYQIMEFWDRLCSGLKAREVSLKDISHKRGMDLRLLYGVAYGKSWFGQWGYVYGRGSFGVNKIMYQSAIEALQNIPINLLVHHLAIDKTETLTTILRYQMLSGHSLITVVDLFRFMLETKSRLPKEKKNITAEESPPSQSGLLLVDASCRWSPKRVDMAIRGVIEALKRAEFRWISRQEVRDAARAYIGDTGLLDFVLKSLGNQVVGKYFVRRCMNPVTKVLEYCLEDISYAFPNQDGFGNGYGYRRLNHESNLKKQYNLSWNQLMKDLFFLYKNILKDNETMNNSEILAHIPVASRIILDTKYFIKDYNVEPAILDNHDLFCSVVLMIKSEKTGLKKVITPHEHFMVKDNSKLDDLRMEVEKWFRDLYVGLKNLVVMGNVINDDDDEEEGMTGSSEIVKSKIINGGRNQIVFEGNIIGDENYDSCLTHECGLVNVVVDCCCGTTFDDGERMICCDICDIRQHTRCVNIPNHEEIPSIFLCNACEQYLLHFPSFL